MLNTTSGKYIAAADIDKFVASIKKNDYKFHQFYNIELETDEYTFIQHMLKFKDSPQAKVLNKTYYDIETYVSESGEFTDPEQVKAPVNSVALYNNLRNICYVISYVTDCDITDADVITKGVLELYEEKVLENEIYKVQDLKIEVIIVENEEELFKKYFSLMRELNTLMLIGFNSSRFDNPYMFNRASALFSEETMKQMASEFGIVDKYGAYSYELPDYLLVDILDLYKPVDQGGGGLGKSLPDYQLNTVAEKELEISKLDLPGGYRENYLHNIIGYLTYNIFDVILTFKLDEKLMFMELMFDLSKYNNASMGATISGRSIIYLYRNDLMYGSQNKLIRAKKFSKEVLFEPSKIAD